MSHIVNKCPLTLVGVKHITLQMKTPSLGSASSAYARRTSEEEEEW